MEIRGAEMFSDEDRDHVAIYTETVDSQTELAEALLLDPLPHLSEKLQLEGDWAVTLNRTNAEIGVGPLKPPRKIIVTWIVLSKLTRVHGVVYGRSPEPGARRRRQRTSSRGRPSSSSAPRLLLGAGSFVAAPPCVEHTSSGGFGRSRLLNVHAPSSGFHEWLRAES